MENPSTASGETENFRFSLPPGWIFDNDAPVPTMACPEGDLHVSFVEMESAGTVQTTAVAAWRKLDPAFDTFVLQGVSRSFNPGLGQHIPSLVRNPSQ
jgi:hypothetical protein